MEGFSPMPRSQKLFGIALVALLAMVYQVAAAQDRGQAPAAQARPAQATPRVIQQTKPFPPEAMDEVLRQWEEQSRKLQTLELDIYRIDRDVQWGDEVHFSGHAAFENPDLAYVDYRKVKLLVQRDPKVKNKNVFLPQKAKNGQLDSDPFQTILCTGKEVWDYRSDVKNLVIWTLDNNSRKKVLDEGPLPFLFRMRAGDAKQRYNMVLRGQDEKYSLIVVTPKIKEDQDVFSTAWVKLERKFLLPAQITLISPDKAKRQDFLLSNFRANKGVSEKYFIGVKPTKISGWTVEVNPLADGPSSGTGKRARRAVDPKAAQRAAPGQDQIQR
jgi:TIGR03009 family protein